eukprot:COSAG04_NODE_658_length_11475_cov_3.480837_1_plen_94_part_00
MRRSAANAERLEKAKLDALQRADSHGETLVPTVRHIVKGELAVVGDDEGGDDDMAEEGHEAEAEKARLLRENRKEDGAQWAEDARPQFFLLTP